MGMEGHPRSSTAAFSAAIADLALQGSHPALDHVVGGADEVLLPVAPANRAPLVGRWIASCSLSQRRSSSRGPLPCGAVRGRGGQQQGSPNDRSRLDELRTSARLFWLIWHRRDLRDDG